MRETGSSYSLDNSNGEKGVRLRTTRTDRRSTPRSYKRFRLPLRPRSMLCVVRIHRPTKHRRADVTLLAHLPQRLAPASAAYRETAEDGHLRAQRRGRPQAALARVCALFARGLCRLLCRLLCSALGSPHRLSDSSVADDLFTATSRLIFEQVGRFKLRKVVDPLERAASS